MPSNKIRQLARGLILLSAALTLAACFQEPEPEAVVYDSEQPAQDVTIIADTSPPEPQPQPQQEIVYEPEYPETYIVQEGDTLWDISTVFLRDPWFWPEIWFKNPQVENPHLIYPGDTLAIIYVGGKRKVQIVTRGDDGSVVTETSDISDDGLQVVKVRPRVRTKPIDATIPSIPIEAIRHLLERPIIIDADTLQNSAYIVASLDDHLVNSINDKLYVRKLDTSTGTGRYQIYRPERPLFDPITGELLGYQALYVGESKLLLRGDPASVRVTNSEREILRDDRVMPVDNTLFERDFFPKPPSFEISGEIVALLDAISQSGQYQTIALNLGQRDGMETGTVLRIRRSGDVIRDQSERSARFRIKLPDEEIGMVMVIRSFEKMSYALIMEANSPISLEDYVETP